MVTGAMKKIQSKRQGVPMGVGCDKRSGKGKPGEGETLEQTLGGGQNLSQLDIWGKSCTGED